MSRIALLWLAAIALSVTPSSAADDLEKGRFVGACIKAAANLYDLPAGILLVLLDVENGRLGEVSENKNHTADIGPMQVNDTWVPRLAIHWRASRESAFRALRDEICANIEGGAWILRQALDEAKGDFWEGVALYHSHSGPLKTAYLRSVYRHALRLEAKASAGSPENNRGEE
jgi:hypothetical protein